MDGSAAGRQAAHASPSETFFLADRVGFLFHKAALVLVEEVEQALATVGMRARYFFVLASLAGGPTLSQQDLSRLLNLDPNTVMAVIDEMERNKHVERRRNPSDRRRNDLFLTESGRAALVEAERAASGAESAFFGSIPSDEYAALQSLLGRLLEGRWPASVCTD